MRSEERGSQEYLPRHGYEDVVERRVQTSTGEAADKQHVEDCIGETSDPPCPSYYRINSASTLHIASGWSNGKIKF